jgi:hypothetical protein
MQPRRNQNRNGNGQSDRAYTPAAFYVEAQSLSPSTLKEARHARSVDVSPGGKPAVAEEFAPDHIT